MSDEQFMLRALKCAEMAFADGEVPVGAVIVKDGKVIATGRNRRERRQSALCHAEIEAIGRACRKTKSWRLEGCTLYVTHEPCVMCAGAAVGARIERIVFGSSDKRFGAFGSAFDLRDFAQGHKYIVEGGVCGELSSALLSRFFAKLRNKSETDTSRKDT